MCDLRASLAQTDLETMEWTVDGDLVFVSGEFPVPVTCLFTAEDGSIYESDLAEALDPDGTKIAAVAKLYEITNPKAHWAFPCGRDGREWAVEIYPE